MASAGTVHLPSLVVLVCRYLNARATGEVQRQSAARGGARGDEGPGVERESGAELAGVARVEVVLAAIGGQAKPRFDDQLGLAELEPCL